MSSEQNKALVRRLFAEVMNQGQLERLTELVAPDFINYDSPMSAPGPARFAEGITRFRSAFPDLHVTIEDDLADGDKVATRGFFTGTHQGEFMGMAPTGTAVGVAYQDRWRVQDGTLVENNEACTPILTTLVGESDDLMGLDAYAWTCPGLVDM